MPVDETRLSAASASRSTGASAGTASTVAWSGFSSRNPRKCLDPSVAHSLKGSASIALASWAGLRISTRADTFSCSVIASSTALATAAADPGAVNTAFRSAAGSGRRRSRAR